MLLTILGRKTQISTQRLAKFVPIEYLTGDSLFCNEEVALPDEGSPVSQITKPCTIENPSSQNAIPPPPCERRSGIYSVKTPSEQWLRREMSVMWYCRRVFKRQLRCGSQSPGSSDPYLESVGEA